MRVIKKVKVKQKLTEAWKEKMWTDLENDKQRFEKEIDQLRFQLQKQLKAAEAPHKKAQVKERFEKEIKKRKEKQHRAKFQQSQLKQLPLGSEIVTGEVDAIEEIQPGDAWPVAEQEIIVEEGKIVSIRKADDNNGMV
ncbi:YlqD protein [Alteribacillus persepolensis]|uniref:YlqD protein n=1 Tax=Alteribacillus persepolensis TaxID=568899 RepID=A0A1G7YLE1_9BACI|nr:YlqD family protein [Alteribacillus persepolensis]SDG97059.1 YlqD protein [Alteribacillus persepolensis]